MDRAALDAALDLRLPTGGWCPLGRRSEDGVIPDRYPLQETPSRSYAMRTEWNVRDSDGTLIVALDEISSGTRLTIESARLWHKPLHIVHLHNNTAPGLLTDENSPEETLSAVVEWIQKHRIRVLNVAGPRGSSGTAVYPEAYAFLRRLFQRVRELLSDSPDETIASDSAGPCVADAGQSRSGRRSRSRQQDT